MINIYDEELGISINLEGNLKEIARKINNNEIISIRGSRFSEKSRSVIDLDLNIKYISEEKYKQLQDIFLYSNSELYIENLDEGRIYKNYYIQGDTLSLDKYEDYENEKYYYKGGISLFKR